MADLHDREDLPYTSQAGLYEDKNASSKDEADLPALQRALKIVEEAEAEARDMLSIDLKHPKLTGDQQIFAYQFALEKLILPFKSTVAAAIDTVKNQNKRGE